MCGIFGILVKAGSHYDERFLKSLLEKLAILSESRGKDSAGLAFRLEKDHKINIIRSAMPVSLLLRQEVTKDQLTEALKSASYPLIVIGHARLATNGSQLIDYNNQPVLKNGIIGVHNGIITNVNEIWASNPMLKREYDIDTEAMLALMAHHLGQGSSIPQSVSKAIDTVYGTVAAALMFEDRDEVVLTTNNGSLYSATNNRDIVIFGSEKYILTALLSETIVKNSIGDCEIRQVRPRTGVVWHIHEFSWEEFDYDTASRTSSGDEPAGFRANITDIPSTLRQLHSVVDEEAIRSNPRSSEERKLLEFNINRINALKRCTRCLLPETFPFIEFDEKGVCNFCNNHVSYNPKGLTELKRIIEPYKGDSGEPDTIVSFSGGRDSTFLLHMAKKELGLNPIAYTYDWGMVTDLARRNIARVCGKLGVENILVSADIRKKRENIRKNITAWLKRPHLGAVPLFMAGDKYFFHHCNELRKQTGIRLNIWGTNPMEITQFKAGFAGLRPQFSKKYVPNFTLKNQMMLLKFAGRNILSNPAYLNSSVSDTIGSYITKYVSPRSDYYRFFDYYPWNEKEVVDLIIREYGWETAKDTDATWRIGDGTASFYDYIYYNVAGFSEVDTFRSNQIREGMITRDDGLKFIEKENYPRYESIKWYLEAVGLDYRDTLERINRIPKLYK
ncbi:MAG: hypothetical protein V1875_09560 [Candidatus Altiarchaeota archaeon]